VVFNGGTISHNNSGSNGGGLICWQTTNTIMNSILISENHSLWGGGIGLIDCDMHVNNCNFLNNSAVDLGGAIGSDFSDVQIANATFTADTSGFLSGAIHSWYSNIHLRQSNFANNTSDFGGAIHADFSALQIDTCIFSQNNAIDGGALHTLNTNLMIDSCLFIQNQAANSGGGIQFRIDTTEYAIPYQLDILNSRFSANSGFNRGAMEIQQLNSDSSLVDVHLSNCEFIGNSVDRGGNLMINGSIDDFVISNSIFTNNNATLRTANCLFNGHANGTVTNCLFAGNNAPGGGTATSVGFGADIDFINCTYTNNNGGGALTLRNNAQANLINTIFWLNEPSEIIISAMNDSTPCSIYINYCDIHNGLDSIVVNDTVSIIHWGIGNFDQDPLFTDTTNYDFHLQNNSPCLEAGIDSINISGIWYHAPLADLEGNPRPYPSGTMPDLGAYEAQYPTNVVNEEDEIPIKFALYQNYPNPFNPKTTIKYDLPKLSFVEIKLFDILGRSIKTLIADSKPAGKYKYVLEGRNLASGIYFIKMQAGDFTAKQKILLVK
jgi:predicted outer membrane repeat protein